MLCVSAGNVIAANAMPTRIRAMRDPRLEKLADVLVNYIDGSIGIWAEENTRALTNCDPKKLGMTQAARKPLMDLFMNRAAEGKLKWVGTQYPTQAAAQDAEMSLEEYEDFVFGAGLLNRP